MINDQLDPKIWPSKAQTSVKDFSSKHIAEIYTQSGRFSQSLGNPVDGTAFWMILTISSKVSRNPLPTWSLPDARTSVLAGCFHFTLPHSCCPFFLEKVCLVANGPRYILSALWQSNFKEIVWQISSSGACMVISQLMYISPPNCCFAMIQVWQAPPPPHPNVMYPSWPPSPLPPVDVDCGFSCG